MMKLKIDQDYLNNEPHFSPDCLMRRKRRRRDDVKWRVRVRSKISREEKGERWIDDQMGTCSTKGERTRTRTRNSLLCVQTKNMSIENGRVRHWFSAENKNNIEGSSFRNFFRERFSSLMKTAGDIDELKFFFFLLSISFVLNVVFRFSRRCYSSAFFLLLLLHLTCISRIASYKYTSHQRKRQSDAEWRMWTIRERKKERIRNAWIFSPSSSFVRIE